MKKKVEAVKQVIVCPSIDGAYEQHQTTLANAIFGRGIEKRMKKGAICYAVSTNAYIKFKDALKLYDAYVQQLDTETRSRLLDEMLEAEPQALPAREVKEGTVALTGDGSFLEDCETTRAFEGVSGIDY